MRDPIGKHAERLELEPEDQHLLAAGARPLSRNDVGTGGENVLKREGRGLRGSGSRGEGSGTERMERGGNKAEESRYAGCWREGSWREGRLALSSHTQCRRTCSLSCTAGCSC